MSGQDNLCLPRGVLFDMDGTLTEPMLDFPTIKAEMGIGSGPILEALAEMMGPRREAAEAVLHRHEEEAAAGSTLNPGCLELLEWIHTHGLCVALITRNSRRSVDVVLARHGLKIEVLVTREDGRFKPDPEPLLVACRRLGIERGEAWMVGDGQYDVEAAMAAGIRAVWVSHGRERPFSAEPWRVARDLYEVKALLEEGWRLAGGRV